MVMAQEREARQNEPENRDRAPLPSQQGSQKSPKTRLDLPESVDLLTMLRTTYSWQAPKPLPSSTSRSRCAHMGPSQICSARTWVARRWVKFKVGWWKVQKYLSLC